MGDLPQHSPYTRSGSELEALLLFPSILLYLLDFSTVWPPIFTLLYMLLPTLAVYRLNEGLLIRQTYDLQAVWLMNFCMVHLLSLLFLDWRVLVVLLAVPASVLALLALAFKSLTERDWIMAATQVLFASALGAGLRYLLGDLWMHTLALRGRGVGWWLATEALLWVVCALTA